VVNTFFCRVGALASISMEYLLLIAIIIPAMWPHGTENFKSTVWDIDGDSFFSRNLRCLDSLLSSIVISVGSWKIIS